MMQITQEFRKKEHTLEGKKLSRWDIDRESISELWKGCYKSKENISQNLNAGIFHGLYSVGEITFG